MIVGKGRWWDGGSWWRWYLVRPVAFQVAGWRDRYATWRAYRDQDVIR
jgi:hypothetical protein